MFAVAAIVFIVVTVLLLVAIIRARRFQNAQMAQTVNDPANKSETVADTSADHALSPIVATTPATDRRAIILVIIGGAIIPAIVLAILMGLGVATDTVNARPPGLGAGPIEVIGHQWWWEVRYPDENIVTANEIHIPVGTPVLFKLTSADVIHSFWVPQLHSKLDMIPGQTNTVWVQADQMGSYQGECAEYCGEQHAGMDFTVVVESADDYAKWVNLQKQDAPKPTTDLVLAGEQTFLGSSCVYCHAIKGTNASGTIGPDLTHFASRATIGAGVLPNTPGNLAGWIINSQAIKPGNKMPPMDLNSDQLQSVLAYLETLK